MILKKIKAWHFVADDRRLAHEPDVLIEPGYIYTVDGPIKICESGLHASRTVYDALQDAAGSFLCRVESWGDVQEQSDKLVARNRHVIAARDVSAELRLWGCWCVRQQWHLLTDERSRRAVEVAEAFARGEATDKELAAAWAAARAVWAASSASSAAMAATCSAAKAASSARAAAKAAAMVASDAAMVASDAAMVAAWAAARAAQSADLERRMLALFEAKP